MNSLTTINETRESTTTPSNSYFKENSIPNSNSMEEETILGSMPTLTSSPKASKPLFSEFNAEKRNPFVPVGLIDDLGSLGNNA